MSFSLAIMISCSSTSTDGPLRKYPEPRTEGVMWKDLTGKAALETAMEFEAKMEERETRAEVLVETRATLHSEAVPLLQALNMVQEGSSLG